MKAIWFNARSLVGIIQVIDHLGQVKYLIGSPPAADPSVTTTCEDIKWISDWGSQFPKEVGDLLFELKPNA